MPAAVPHPVSVPPALPHGRQPTLAEIMADRAADGAATGFVLAQLKPDAGPVLWVQDRLSLREAGRPWPAGMGPGVDLLHLVAGRAADVLWAMEQGLDCRALSAVVGEIWGEAPAVDFTATKRLALRAEALGVACWLIRRGARPDLSAARERWRVGSVPSAPDPDDARAPGGAVWQADLFRARFRAPGSWIARPAPGCGLVLSHPAAAEEAAGIRAAG